MSERNMRATTSAKAASRGAGDALAAQLEQGYTLPAAWYTDPATFAREQARIFRRAWQYAGLTEELPRPGDFLTRELGGAPVVLLRDRDGQLRAFANVCRHRGSQLVLDACGNRKTLQCHYHAWTYNLDGTLRAAPGMKDEPGFDRACHSLVALPHRDVGTVHLRQSRPGCRAARTRRWANCRDSSPRRGWTWAAFAGACARPMRSRRTGRWW